MFSKKINITLLISGAIIILAIFDLVIYSKIKSRVLGISTTNSDKTFLELNGTQELKYFFEPKANFADNKKRDWLDYTPQITINSDTLNASQDYSVDKPEGVFRIIALGDSFTFGANVNTTDNYPSQLEDLFNKKCGNTKYEVLNLGVGAYDFQFSVQRYIKRGVKYNPDLVLWLFIDDDFVRYDEKIQEIYNSDQYAKERENASPNNTMKRLTWGKIKEQVAAETGLDNILDIDRTSLKDLRKIYFNPLVLLTLNPIQPDHKNLLDDFISSSSNVFSNHIAINTTTNDQYHLPDGHPSALGHKLIAQDIFNYLTSNKLVPCN